MAELTPALNRYWIITYMVRSPRWLASGGNIHYVGTEPPTYPGLKALAVHVPGSNITVDDELVFTIVEYNAHDYYHITGIQKPKTP